MTATSPLPRITAQDAADEPPAEQLFHESAAPAFPASVITIQAVSANGFPVTITLNDPASGALSKWLDLLTSRGFAPPAAPAASATPAAGKSAGGMTRRVGDPGVQIDGDGTPLCWEHTGRKMKRSNFGGWFCTGGQDDDRCKCKVKD